MIENLYCERLAAGVLAEPLNLFTNLAFFIAAICALRLSRRVAVASSGLRLLIGLCVAIGIGSMLFHSIPSTPTRIADEVPILLFQLCFFWLYLRRIALLAAAPTTLLLVMYLVLAFYSRGFPLIANGTLIYVPAFVSLLMVSAYHALHQRSERWTLLAASALFALSCTLRMLDRAVCPHFPTGTHFMWHLLNASVIFLALRTIIMSPITRNGLARAP